MSRRYPRHTNQLNHLNSTKKAYFIVARLTGNCEVSFYLAAAEISLMQLLDLLKLALLSK